jgi:hypothetical protein
MVKPLVCERGFMLKGTMEGFPGHLPAYKKNIGIFGVKGNP